MPAMSFLRRKAALWSVAALVLFAVVALSSRRVSAVDDKKCESATVLMSDPQVAAFKQCANASPIPLSCCIKLAPFVSYAECLQLPRFRDMANAFLEPVVTVDRALRECLGR